MIPDFFLDLAMGFIGWVLDLFPADTGDDAVSFIDGFADILTVVLSNAAGLGAWVPWVLVVPVVGTIVTLWGVFTLVKFVTWVKGLFWASS